MLTQQRERDLASGSSFREFRACERITNMPLIIITGLPASGKSTRAAQVKKVFEDRGKTVRLVSEWQCIQLAGYDKNEYFSDSQKEKLVRSNAKSEALRMLNKDDVVIVDGGNYIKGYRYEIFCASKASRTTQCTVYCAITKDQAWHFNETRDEEREKYREDVFDALCQRYEEPQHNNRWDSPLFTVFPEEELDDANMYNALFEAKPLVPNLSTQNVSNLGNFSREQNIYRCVSFFLTIRMLAIILLTILIAYFFYLFCEAYVMSQNVLIRRVSYSVASAQFDEFPFRNG